MFLFSPHHCQPSLHSTSFVLTLPQNVVLIPNLSTSFFRVPRKVRLQIRTLPVRDVSVNKVLYSLLGSRVSFLNKF